MFVIIGASSFIGVYTTDYFVSQGERIIVTGRNQKFKDYYAYSENVEYMDLDLTDPHGFDSLPRENIDGVILISGALPASETANLRDTENTDRYITINTLGTIHALEYCRKNGIKRLINTISYADVANRLTDKTPMTENTPRDFSLCGDHAAYVISKNAAADLMEYYNQQHGMKNVWFRLPPVYGVGPHGYLNVNGHIIKSGLQIFIDKARMGETIEVYGHLARDIVYVKDVAKAYFLAAKSDSAIGLYNITSGKTTTLLEQAYACADVFAPDRDHRSRVVFRSDVENQGRSYLFSIEKARRDFYYSPEFSDFHRMMEDYKAELELGRYSALFRCREV